MTTRLRFFAGCCIWPASWRPLTKRCLGPIAHSGSPCQFRLSYGALSRTFFVLAIRGMAVPRVVGVVVGKIVVLFFLPFIRTLEWHQRKLSVLDSSRLVAMRGPDVFVSGLLDLSWRLMPPAEHSPASSPHLTIHDVRISVSPIAGVRRTANERPPRVTEQHRHRAMVSRTLQPRRH